MALTWLTQVQWSCLCSFHCQRPWPGPADRMLWQSHVVARAFWLALVPVLVPVLVLALPLLGSLPPSLLSEGAGGAAAVSLTTLPHSSL